MKFATATILLLVVITVARASPFGFLQDAATKIKGVVEGGLGHMTELQKMAEAVAEQMGEGEIQQLFQQAEELMRGEQCQEKLNELLKKFGEGSSKMKDMQDKINKMFDEGIPKDEIQKAIAEVASKLQP